MAGPRLLRAFGDAFPAARFVEIGANDGLRYDHLRPLIERTRWRGVMVEPVPYVFERLRANYAGNERVSLERAAIASRNGPVTFYHLAGVPDHQLEGLPQWYDGIGSLSRESVLSHARLIPDIEQRLVEATVPALTFEALCEKHQLDAVDVVLIDAEGYDNAILEQIDFERHRPVLVVYEHYHLNAEERSRSAERMRRAGYELLEEGFDTWCLRTDADRTLAALWRKLRPGAPGLYVEDEPQ